MCENKLKSFVCLLSVSAIINLINRFEFLDISSSSTFLPYNEWKSFYQSNWHEYFMGRQFDEYRKEITKKMMKLRKEIRLKTSNICDHPLYRGEFGKEMRVMVPWAYHKSQHCRVYTKGVTGTKYMYFFSYNHTIKKESRNGTFDQLPDGNPFQRRGVHINDFPYDTEWLAPNFKNFFIKPDIYELLSDKPLVVIINKYRKQWQYDEAINFMSIDLLRDILTYLVPKYSILYKRHTAIDLQDNNQKRHGFHDFADKEMIRKEFPMVKLYDDLQVGLTDVEDQNLLLFGIMSLSDRFLSVQGGAAVVSSYFGGKTTILISAGPELAKGDYTYFHRFSNSSVEWTNRDKIYAWKKRDIFNQKQTEKEYLDLVKKQL